MNRSSGKRPSHLGAKLFWAAGLGLLLTGIILLFSTIHLQLQWRTFQLQFAACTYDAGTEGGWLKATSATEVVDVAPKNASSLFNMAQTAGAVSIGRLRDPAEQIKLEYSNGGHGALSLCTDGQVHIDLTDPNGKHWRFYLGRCNYKSMAKVLSAEGAAVENAHWVD